MGKYLKSVKAICLVVGLVIAIQSCINDSNVIENISERAHKKILVLGYGSEKGASSKGAEMLARQFAIASLGEQIGGNRFSYMTSGSNINFKAESKADIPGMREYEKRIERVGNQYLVFYVMGTEIDIEYPRQFGIYDESYGESGVDIKSIIADMKLKAVKEAASERFKTRMPKKLEGRLFITAVKVVKEEESESFRVESTLSVLFDSMSR